VHLCLKLWPYTYIVKVANEFLEKRQKIAVAKWNNLVVETSEKSPIWRQIAKSSLILTRELRGECGARRFSVARNMTSWGRGSPRHSVTSPLSGLRNVWISIINNFSTLSLLLSFILNLPQHEKGTSWYTQVFKNVNQQDIHFKIKIAIFAERYPFFLLHRTTNVKINNSVFWLILKMMIGKRWSIWSESREYLSSALDVYTTELALRVSKSLRVSTFLSVFKNKKCY